MNKTQLLKHLVTTLETVHASAVAAAQRAYETATDEENEAENKYDTLGLEASYLAQGQAKRVAECEADVIAFKKIPVIDFSPTIAISIGALVELEDEQGALMLIFLSPVAGGLKTHFNHQNITLITPSSPLGRALIGRVCHDEVIVAMGERDKTYLINAVY